jgi:hypothetical protein
VSLVALARCGSLLLRSLLVMAWYRCGVHNDDASTWQSLAEQPPPPSPRLPPPPSLKLESCCWFLLGIVERATPCHMPLSPRRCGYALLHLLCSDLDLLCSDQRQPTHLKSNQPTYLTTPNVSFSSHVVCNCLALPGVCARMLRRALSLSLSLCTLYTVCRTHIQRA